MSKEEDVQTNIVFFACENQVNNLVDFTVLLVYVFLLHTAIRISKFILFTCCCFLVCCHRFTFRISKNKSIRFVSLRIFQVIFYSKLPLLYLALSQPRPFLSVLSCSEFGPFVQRQCLVKAKSMSFLNSETKVDLLRVTEIQFRIKFTYHLQVKTLLNNCLPCFTSDVLAWEVCIQLFAVLIK